MKSIKHPPPPSPRGSIALIPRVLKACYSLLMRKKDSAPKIESFYSYFVLVALVCT